MWELIRRSGSEENIPCRKTSKYRGSVLAASRVHFKISRRLSTESWREANIKEPGKVGQRSGHAKSYRPKDFSFIFKAVKNHLKISSRSGELAWSSLHFEEIQHREWVRGSKQKQDRALGGTHILCWLIVETDLNLTCLHLNNLRRVHLLFRNKSPCRLESYL